MNKKDKKFVQQFYSRAGACIREHAMIEDGDKLMVGVSGGKDSLALLKTLAGRQPFSDKHYTLKAVFVDIMEIPYKTDIAWMQQFCDALDVPLHVERISVDFSKTNNQSTCFYCSWHRRKTLFKLGKSMDANKIALGHHRDDALETMMLNMVSHGTLSSMPGNLPMFGGSVNLIRPLLNHTDKQTIEFARIMDFPLSNKPCPHENNTRRIQIREMLQSIEKQFPGARKNMFKAMSQIYLDYLPSFHKEQVIIRDNRILKALGNTENKE
ncbi:MAG: ATP-binding protein [Bacteroidota bacterium]|nr:ATP-binding protein [Bacteroidota bacterium]